MLTSGTFMVVGTLTPIDATADISACSCALIKSAFSLINHVCSFDSKASTFFSACFTEVLVRLVYVRVEGIQSVGMIINSIPIINCTSAEICDQGGMATNQAFECVESVGRRLQSLEPILRLFWSSGSGSDTTY